MVYEILFSAGRFQRHRRGGFMLKSTVFYWGIKGGQYRLTQMEVNILRQAFV